VWKFPRISVCFLLFLFSVSCQKPVNAAIDLALNKSYTLNPKPNYDRCTDSGDTVQLTDGRVFGSYWLKKSTVGWYGSRKRPVIEIVVDLERISVIKEVRVYTVGGGVARVEFAEYIAVQVSKTGTQYKLAGLAGADQLSSQYHRGRKRRKATLVINNLNTKARFVKLLVRPTGSYFFLDEIEVIGAGKTQSKGILPGSSLAEFSSEEKLLGAVEDYLQVRENVRETAEALRGSRNRLSAEAYTELSKDLDVLSEQFKLPTNELYHGPAFLAHREMLGRIRARIYRQIYDKPFVCFAANPMEVVLEKDMQIKAAEKLRQIDIQLWQQEYESAAVTVINCSQKPVEAAVLISDITDDAGRKIDNSRTFTIRRTVFLKGQGTGSLADALVLQGNRPFSIAPGEVTQIWLTIFNPFLGAGNYRGSLVVTAVAGGQELGAETIELKMSIAPIRFPCKASLNSCVWDMYPPLLPVVGRDLPGVAEDLRSHRTNISVIHPSYVPSPRRERFGTGLFREVDFLKFMKQIRVFGFADMYLLCLDWHSGRSPDGGKFGPQWMSPGWKRNFSSWLRMLVARLKKEGIDYSKFALYPFDETLCDEFYELAKLIKEIDPKVQIYADSTGRKPKQGPKTFRKFRDLIDIWCLVERDCDNHPGWLEQIKGYGKEVWTYETSRSGKIGRPNGYYRLMAWRAFKRGQTGVGFWVYIGKEFSWDDTMLARGDYAVVYASSKSSVQTHGEAVVPSRRWEIWRDGIEDYEYLQALNKAIETINKSHPAQARQAQRVLDAQVKYVLSRPLDCDAVYKARETLTETILKLNSRLKSRN